MYNVKESPMDIGQAHPDQWRHERQEDNCPDREA
jgi:hypothetical protein